MKDITKIEKLAYQYNGEIISNIGPTTKYNAIYNVNAIDLAVISYISPILSPVYGAEKYHFTSQGRTFNDIFKDNLDYYKELIDGKHTGVNQRDGIKDLKRENAVIAMRSDD